MAHSKNVCNSETAEYGRFIPIEDEHQIMDTLHYGDVTIGLERPQAAETVILPKRPSKSR